MSSSFISFSLCLRVCTYCLIEKKIDAIMIDGDKGTIKSKCHRYLHIIYSKFRSTFHLRDFLGLLPRAKKDLVI